MAGETSPLIEYLKAGVGKIVDHVAPTDYFCPGCSCRVHRAIRMTSDPGDEAGNLTSYEVCGCSDVRVVSDEIRVDRKTPCRVPFQVEFGLVAVA